MGGESRILLVDDDPMFGAEAVRWLRAADLDVTFHQGPLGTLQAVKATRCELVVIDVNMPKVDGGLLVRMIRDAFGLGRTRVMLCSDMRQDVLTALAKALQVPSVAKSAGFEVLVESVRAALREPRVRGPDAPDEANPACDSDTSCVPSSVRPVTPEVGRRRPTPRRVRGR
ncbi:response regulator [Polyangium jinanense]|uniref:Response regulator transcription factor n=1 Tax=Polyangium jinanense TaxID=2829994 RepID=A0A9X3X4N6_9BACT|nr:response regulator [Polyangium jinanense]MDC3984204.1 response regulator transcription factor [Polyangium jinanense]